MQHCVYEASVQNAESLTTGRRGVSVLLLCIASCDLSLVLWSVVTSGLSLILLAALCSVVSGDDTAAFTAII